MLDRVGGGADHAVVESQSKSLGRGKGRVDAGCVCAVCLPKRAEEAVCLRGKILACTDAKEVALVKEGDVLVVAKNGAIGFLLLPTEKVQHALARARKQHEGGCRGVMAVFHAGGEGALVLGQAVRYGVGHRNVIQDHAKRVVGNAAGAEERGGVAVHAQHTPQKRLRSAALGRGIAAVFHIGECGGQGVQLQIYGKAVSQRLQALGAVLVLGSALAGELPGKKK